MADSSPRRSRPNYGSLVGSTRSRRSRASLRVPSNRSSSIVYDEYLHPSGPAPPQALRSASSRFSLNEQFATSRQEYDFSFDDDASSIYERTAPVSEAGDVTYDRASPAPLAAIDESWQSIPPPATDEADTGDEDYYDLLCLPREPSITPHQIRQAYWRSLFLLQRDAQATTTSDLLSNAVFVRLQQAFETLIDPIRRANYDSCRVAGMSAPDSDAADDDLQVAYRDALVRHLGATDSRAMTSATDIGVRYDASRANGGDDLTILNVSKPLDFVMDHSLTTVIPGTETFSWKGNQLRLHDPELTVSGLVSGRLGNKPPKSGSARPQRVQQWPSLAGSGSVAASDLPLAPLLAFKLRQDISLRLKEQQPSRYTLEFEQELLAPGFTARVSHPLTIRNAREPWIVEATIHHGQSRTTRVPLIGIGAHRITTEGTFSANVNSGSWGNPLDATCRSFAEFSRQIMSHGEAALNLPPSLDLEYTTHNADFVSLPYQPTSPDGHPLADSKAGWSVSSTLTPHSAGAYMRYARDLMLPSPSGSPLSQTTTRLELEVSSDTALRHSLALRSLWRVGTSSCAGLELSVGSQTVHLSLHWSRLKHRLSLPVLITSPAASTSTFGAFWLAAVPFSVLGGAQILLSRWNRPVRKAGRSRSLQELQACVARRRSEAMDFVKLIWSAVETKQEDRRRQGELVILSASYGATEGLSDQKFSTEQAADVTTALASLVDDDGVLFIPPGLRKSGLPGFWDAAPGQDKTLRVRYSYRGHEIDIEVPGRDGLRLPPS